MPKSNKPRRSNKTSASAARKRTVTTKGKQSGRAASRRTAKTGRQTAGAMGGALGVGGALQGAPSHILIFLPGFPGSELIDPTNNDKVWVDFSLTNILKHGGAVNLIDNMFAKMQFPHPDPNFKLKVGSVIENVFGGLPIELQYSRIRNFLEGLGYKIDPADNQDPDLICYFFGYDWRQDYRRSAQQLGQQIAAWQDLRPGREIWLMGHSGGGIVSRWYINQEGGDQIVKRMFLLASPWDGSLAILDVLLNGMKVPFDLDALANLDLSARTRDALRTYPGAYQIIPHQRHFLYGPDGQVVDPYSGAWLDPAKPEQFAMLQDAKAFHQTMGNTIKTDHVEVLAFIGYNKPTITLGRVTFTNGNRWDKVTWASPELLGDGTVPQYSAEYNDAKRIFTYIAAHSDIYDHDRVKARLAYELKTKYLGTPEPVLGVEPEAPGAPAADLLDDENRDLQVTIQYPLKKWTPGQPVNLRVTVQNIKTGEPVTNAEVSAKLVFLQQLLGTAEKTPPQALPPISVQQHNVIAGLYEAALQTPTREGYYELRTTVKVPNESPIVRQDKITVKAPTP